LDIFTGAHEFLVASLLMGPVCLLSHGRFEEPVRTCVILSTVVTAAMLEVYYVAAV